LAWVQIPAPDGIARYRRHDARWRDRVVRATREDDSRVEHVSQRQHAARLGQGGGEEVVAVVVHEPGLDDGGDPEVAGRPEMLWPRQDDVLESRDPRAAMQSRLAFRHRAQRHPDRVVADRALRH